MNIQDLFGTEKFSILSKINDLQIQKTKIDEEINKLIADNGLEGFFKAPSTATGNSNRSPIERKVLHYFTVERLLKKTPLTKEEFWKSVQADAELAFCDEAMFNKSVEHYLANGKIVEVKGKLAMKKK